MMINYVLREGRRVSVGNGSVRSSLSDFLVGELGALLIVVVVIPCDPVDNKGGERCTELGTSTGS